MDVASRERHTPFSSSHNHPELILRRVGQLKCVRSHSNRRFSISHICDEGSMIPNLALPSTDGIYLTSCFSHSGSYIAGCRLSSEVTL